MDTTETQYVSVDADEVYEEMQIAYMAAGGDALYPGDEKEMMLRAMQSVIVQSLSVVNNALRMATLRYATGEHLDLYGQKRNCYRIAARAATAKVSIVFHASNVQKTIPTGTVLTPDGENLYILAEDVQQTGLAQTVEAEIEAALEGVVGNSLKKGTAMQFYASQPAVDSVTCAEDAEGGQEAEDDESYRERIRRFGLSAVTTGPATQYEAKAMAASSNILDAKAVNQGAGKVGIALILAEKKNADATIKAVEDALNGSEVRPLTDVVNVFEATEIPYTLQVTYQAGTTSGTAAKMAEVVKNYQEWQDETVGRAFNPDRLMAELYQAGATRVKWGDGSSFRDGPVTYTEIAPTERCKGTITLSILK